MYIDKDFFAKGTFDDHLTYTNITLVHKKQNLSYMTELRLISLCDAAAYKIVLKVVTNRLKKVIDEVIRKFIVLIYP